MLNVSYAECLKYALYAQCHYAECRCAECRGTVYDDQHFTTVIEVKKYIPYCPTVSTDINLFLWRNSPIA